MWWQHSSTPKKRGKGFRVDPADYPFSVYVRWYSDIDPPEEPMCARVLASVLRRTFHDGMASVGDDHMGTKSFILVGVTLEYESVAQQGGNAAYKSWHVTWSAANKQPWTSPFFAGGKGGKGGKGGGGGG